jgi:hypothetical protein
MFRLTQLSGGRICLGIWMLLMPTGQRIMLCFPNGVSGKIDGFHYFYRGLGYLGQGPYVGVFLVMIALLLSRLKAVKRIISAGGRNHNSC